MSKQWNEAKAAVMEKASEPCSMLEGGDVTPEETLAIQLWYTWFKERGDLGVSAWLKGANPIYLAAQKWLYLDGVEKAAWMAVAEKAQQLVAAPVGG